MIFISICIIIYILECKKHLNVYVVDIVDIKWHGKHYGDFKFHYVRDFTFFREL